MDSGARWVRVEELFHSALDLDPSARADYLEHECGGDVDLRRRVESLLQRDEATSPIDRPIGSEPPARSLRPLPARYPSWAKEAWVRSTSHATRN